MYPYISWQTCLLVCHRFLWVFLKPLYKEGLVDELQRGMNLYLTNSEFKQPLPTNASFGCKYLKNVFLITLSLFTFIPICSNIALILVYSFCSPPSAIIRIALPPSSMYRLMSLSSCALNSMRGPPSNNRSTSFNLFKVISPLFISHYPSVYQTNFK